MGRTFSLSFICLVGLSCLSLSASFGMPRTRITGSCKLHSPMLTTLSSTSSQERHSISPSMPSELDFKGLVPTTSDSKINKIATVAATLAGCVFMFTQPAVASELMTAISEKAPDSGFLQAFLLILVSELGDKTFFIAGLLAAKYGRFISFTGSIGALSVMTIISTVLGQLFHAVPSSLTQGVPFDDYIAIAAFTYFGVKTLYDASQLESDDNSGILEEQAEAEKTVEELTADQKRKSSIALILQTFSLVFAAEIGDRSFLSTIALSAALNPFAVAAGAIGGHGVATGIAVAGGALLSKYLSEKVIGYIGGSLFIVFAITTAFGVF
jgi:putative Ca2+/H+ antiporter (TMEM165/GDT1 family)